LVIGEHKFTVAKVTRLRISKIRKPARFGVLHQSEASHKPNSVKDDHLSGIWLTPDLKQPTRESNETGRFSSPIWSCSRRGLPCVPCYQETGGLLLHLFTLIPPYGGTVYFLWHFP